MSKADRESGFYRLRWNDGRMAIGFLHPLDEPQPWDPEPRERWSVLFSEDTALQGTTASYTVTRDMPEDLIGKRIEWEE
jgi:hypothetical protein